MPFGDDAAIFAEISGRTVELLVTATGMTSLTVYRVAAGDNVVVRGALDAAAPVGLWAGADVEPPQGRTISYGAEISDGSNTFVIPPIEVSGTVDYGGDYLMPVGQAALGMNITVDAGGMGALTREVQQDVQPILNRRSPVVVSHGRRFFTGEITFLTLTDAEREDLAFILEYPVVMFVSRPGYGFSEPVYLSIGKAEEARTSPLGHEPSRRWKVAVVKVDRPPADYPYTQIGDIWQVRVDANVTWTQAAADFLSWRGFAGYPS